MRTVGTILVLVGIAALAFGGFSYTKKETVAEVGPLKVQTENRHSIPIQPIFGGAAIVAGLVLAIAGNKKKA